jgi:hypothetical protein
MWRRESHKGDAMLEVVAALDNLMLLHVKIMLSIVVLCKQFDETDEFG